MAQEQIYTLTLKAGRAVAYQYTATDGTKRRAVVPMFKTATGKAAPVRCEWMGKGHKTWTKTLNRGWQQTVTHVVDAVGGAA